ncbi:MAG: hypothetical protein ACK4KW_06865 [Gemmobacter sp.]
MRVRENTDHRLVLEDRPWLVGGIVVVFILLLAAFAMFSMSEGAWLVAIVLAAGAILGGGLGLYLFVRRTEVEFDRDDNRVTIRTVTVVGDKVQRHPLDRMRRATVETQAMSGRGTERAARVSLVFSEAGADWRVPLTLAYTTGPEPAEIATLVNRWKDGIG